jgi:alkylhydroperoxidase family enzyme
MGTNRISYVPLEQMDERMQQEMHRCAREGTPRPESSAVRAHAPNAFWAFADSWKAVFHSGVCDHAIKELCRVYISRTVKCEFCGNQRSIKAVASGLQDQQYDQLLNFETAEQYDDRQKAALAYAEAIAWRLDPTDELWNRLLGIDHHEYLAGTDASMAPGFRTAEELAASKASPDYWAAGAPR